MNSTYIQIAARVCALRLSVCVAAAAGVFAATDAFAEHRIVIVVGNNASQDENLDPLRFADDDAFKYFHFFSFVADDVVLLTSPDDETRPMYRNAGYAAPTRQAVLDAIDEKVEAASALAAKGEEVVVYLVYSGHGNYDQEGRGYVHLEDGKLTTRDLFYHLIGKSEGFYVVLLFDACNASFLVKSRGGTSDRRTAGPSTLNLENYDNVGVVLSSSQTGEVKEWGRYLAGIFSHQVRSALTGVADVDRNRQITFQELASFVESANRAVENPALKLTPYIRPPTSRPDLALIDFSTATFNRFLSLQFQTPTRVTVFDEDLVRFADARLDTGYHARLNLPAGRYYVSVEEAEFQVAGEAKGEIFLEDLPSAPSQVLASRGTDQYYVKHLFSVPYGQAFALDYLDGDYEQGLVFSRFSPRPWYENEPAWATVGLGAALLGAGGYLAALASAEHDRAMDTPWADERAAYNRNIDQYNIWTTVTAVAGGAAIATGVALFVFDQPLEESVIAPRVGPGISIMPMPTGAAVEGRF